MGLEALKITYKKFFRTRKPIECFCDLENFSEEIDSNFYDEVIFAYHKGKKIGQIGRVGGWIYGLTVKPEFRRKGIASKLLKMICEDVPEYSAWLYGAEKATEFYRNQKDWIDFGELGENVDKINPKDHLFGKSLIENDKDSSFFTEPLEKQAKLILSKLRNEIRCETIRDIREFVNNADSNTPVTVLIQNKRKYKEYNTITMSISSKSPCFEISLKKSKNLLDYKET